MTSNDENPALNALLDYQQADEEGIMVLVSRQAIHEVADTIEAQAEQIADLTDERDDYAQAARAEASERERAHRQIAELVKGMEDALPTLAASASDDYADSEAIRILDNAETILAEHNKRDG